MQMRELMAGRGQHTGQQPFILNFGLGQVEKVDSIVVRWPDDNCSRSVIHSPVINQSAIANSFPVDVPAADKKDDPVKIFPNPATRYVVVQSTGLVSRVASVSVSDIQGRKLSVEWQYSDQDKIVCDLGTLPGGVYYITLSDQDGVQTAHPVVRTQE